MKLYLKCQCGSTEFAYIADDTYECAQCRNTSLVLILPEPEEGEEPQMSLETDMW